MDTTWRDSPATRIAFLREFAQGVNCRLFLWMPMGWTPGNIYCVTCSDVLQPTLRDYFTSGDGFSVLPGEKWVLYIGARMPLSGGVAVQDAFSQEAGNFDTAITFTQNDINFVCDCVRFFSGFHQLFLDAVDQPSDDAVLNALGAEFGRRNWFTPIIGGEPIPLIYGPSGLPSDNTINTALIGLRPWYMLYNDFVATRDPSGVWEVDPATTEVHIKMDATTLNTLGETAGLALLNDLVDRGFIIDWGGGPSWAENWWRTQYGL